MPEAQQGLPIALERVVLIMGQEQSWNSQTVLKEFALEKVPRESSWMSMSMSVLMELNVNALKNAYLSRQY